MGMSHAVAVWIPGVDVDAEKLEELVKKSCQRHEELGFWVFTRETPAATCIVAPLDEHPELEGELGLLDEVAAKLAKTFRRRTWSLFAFFGSADWMQVVAFSEKGKKRWVEASNEGGGDDDQVTADGELWVGDGVGQPYWRMVSELASRPVPDDVVGLGLKPAFDLASIPGWELQREFSISRRPLEPGTQEWAALDLPVFKVVERASVPLTEIEVLAGWPEDERASTQRETVRGLVSREAPSVGLSFVGVCDKLEMALSDALRAIAWPVETTKLYVRLPGLDKPRYLAVKLGELVLHYPADLEHRYFSSSAVILETSSGDAQTLTLHRARMLGAGHQSEAVERVLRVALSTDEWLFSALDLIRERRLVPVAAKPSDRTWRVFSHPDGRVWSVAPTSEGFWLRLGAPDDDPVIKERKGEALQPLIDEQLAEGFVEAQPA
jgi:hypothetical protein